MERKEMHKCTSNNKVSDGGHGHDHVKSEDPDAEWRRQIARDVKSPPKCGGSIHSNLDTRSKRLSIFANSVIRAYNERLCTGKKYELDKIISATATSRGVFLFYDVIFHVKEVVAEEAKEAEDKDMCCKKRKPVRKFMVFLNQLTGETEVRVAVGPVAKLYEPVNTRIFTIFVPEEDRIKVVNQKQRMKKSKKKSKN